MNEPEQQLMSHQFALAFPTLIGRFQLSNTTGINEKLLQTLLDRESSQPSVDYANQGGWHSSSDLLEWSTPEIGQLRQWISEALNRIVQATGQLPEVQGKPAPRGSFRISAWGNISRIGNYHRMHNHPDSAWSGVYYVTDAPTNPGNPLDGVLEFYDPRPFTEMVEVPGSPYGQRMLVRPMQGLMVLFPSWLYHFVHPVASQSLRASIAFNASWRPS